MLTLRYNEPVFILMLRGRVGCYLTCKNFKYFKQTEHEQYLQNKNRLRQPTLPLSIRINTGSLYRNVSILNYKRDKDNVS